MTRKCIRCGAQTDEGFSLLASVGTVSTNASTGDMSFGGGEGQVMLSRRVPTGETGLFGREKTRMESAGAACAAVCPNCGEVSIYVEKK